ncbi:hypothetical protein ACFVQB_14790 [Paenibacillus sp. NPDC057886]|uniref:hypothetical protein n=1 Tax=Paenibacillus sp. NPDC057886 TaxID=3346270 RepID=UPI0036A0C8EA
MNLFSITPVGILETKAKDLIVGVFPNVLNQISYLVQSYIPEKAHQIANEENMIADGAYENRVIYLYHGSTVRTAVHEIGHAVHYQLFDGTNLSLSNTYRNHKEEFAEIFTNIIFKSYDDEPLNNEENKLKEIIAQRCN